MDPVIAPYLSYSSWVYLSKHTRKKPCDVLKTLEDDARITSNYLELYLVEYLQDSWSIFELCFSSPKVKDEIKNNFRSLLNFAIVNKTNLQMICDYLDKYYKVDIFSNWLQENNNSFKFNNGYVLTRLKFEVQKKDIECPICYESINHECPCIILKCGHILCVNCLKNIYKITNTKGTLDNMIKYRECFTSDNVSCPICRFVNPCGGINKINVFPKKSILKF